MSREKPGMPGLTRAAATGLIEALTASTETEPGVLGLVLDVVGDQLRLGLGTSPELLQYCSAASDVVLQDVVDLRIAEMDRQLLPGPGARDPEDLLEAAVVVRDRAQSLQVALYRVAFRRGVTPTEVGGCAELATATERFDAFLAERVSRGKAESALADRRQLLGDHPWTRCLREEGLPQSVLDALGKFRGSMKFLQRRRNVFQEARVARLPESPNRKPE